MKNEELIINHSKGKLVIPYTKSREKEVLSKMRAQIDSWYGIVGEEKFLKFYFNIIAVCHFASFRFRKFRENFDLRKDYNKNILFYKNEQAINEEVKKKALELGIGEECSVTINDVHFLSTKDIENLIDRQVSEEFVYKMRKTI